MSEYGGTVAYGLSRGPACLELHVGRSRAPCLLQGVDRERCHQWGLQRKIVWKTMVDETNKLCNIMSRVGQRFTVCYP